jgi:hypothetical protein
MRVGLRAAAAAERLGLADFGVVGIGQVERCGVYVA